MCLIYEREIENKNQNENKPFITNIFILTPNPFIFNLLKFNTWKNN